MTFPDDWPEGCPPAGAMDASGEVFRMVRINPPNADDFKSFAELGIERGDPILCRGISVFVLRADAEHAARKFRNMGKILTHGVLLAEHGKSKQTGKPSHTTWWPYVEVNRLSLFAVIGTVT